MKKRIILWLSIGVVALLAVACLLPTSRFMLIGLLKNEPWAEARQIYDEAGTVESAHAQRRPLSFWMHQLNDERAARRLQAARALGTIGSRAKPAVPRLLQVVRDKRLSVRLAAIEALGRIGPDAKDAVPDLIKFYQDRNENEDIRKASVLALGDMTPAANDAVPVMIKKLAEDEAFALSGHVQMAVTSMGAAAVPDLIELLQDQDHEVRAHAAVALNWIGPEARDAVPALIRALQDDTNSVRQGAAFALLRIGPDAEDADDAPKASGAIDGKRVTFPEQGQAVGVKAAVDLLESCHDESLYQADEFKKALQGDHVRLVFAKRITARVMNKKIEFSELVFRLPMNTGVFWVRTGDKWRRYSKYEPQKVEPFTAWLRQARPAD